MTRVAVLKGGPSLEREVSLRSGTNVEMALGRLGHEVIALDADQHLVRSLRDERPEVAFIALHGRGGEDGTVQEILEILRIPYTGSGVLASERAMDKVVSKALFRAAGVPVPHGYAFNKSAFSAMGAADTLPEIQQGLGLPLVVKPARQGSALGISIVKEPGDLGGAILNAMAYDDRVLVERFVPGRELAVSVVMADDPWALPVIEAVTTGRDFYDFEARYTPGETELRAPRDLDDDIIQEAARVSIAAARALGCRGIARVDLILDDEGRLWVLEANTIPGMTDTSLLPKAAEIAGLGFDRVVADMLDLAALDT
ncbi:MAG: D-alanine--D-alanine ligase [Thermoleophilia bacterium]|jgi:D-alanine-D-alanine ligase|nr:D-alanine--D-alanine ligase [Thermoleophilia bacterium]